MNSYVFMSDSDSDLWFSIARERNIPIVRMPYSVDGQEYFDDNGEAGNNRAFFERMRAGALPSTSLLPTDAYLDYFEPILKEQDLLFVAFSSAMSNTFLNIQEARNILLEKYPQRRFTIVDTMSISGPQSLLLLRAHDLYVQGKSMEEVERWILENRMNAQAYFTVDDLKYPGAAGASPAPARRWAACWTSNPSWRWAGTARWGRRKRFRDEKKHCAPSCSAPRTTSSTPRTRRFSCCTPTPARTPNCWHACSARPFQI